MALELVTGYWGQEHVTAEQDADLNAGVVGSGMYVMPIGEKMRAEAVTSNKVRIFDGLFLGYGRQCVIEEGAYEDVEIENGTAGLLRNDMIVVKYAKDEVTGVEGVSFGVLKGQTGATGVDPVPNNQDIRSGAFESEMPLYRVKLNGLAIEAIQPLFAVPKSIAALTTALDDLNRNIEVTFLDKSFGGVVGCPLYYCKYTKILYCSTVITGTFANGTNMGLISSSQIDLPNSVRQIPFLATNTDGTTSYAQLSIFTDGNISLHNSVDKSMVNPVISGFCILGYI